MFGVFLAGVLVGIVATLIVLKGKPIIQKLVGKGEEAVDRIGK